jgi:hypothetical protein
MRFHLLGTLGVASACFLLLLSASSAKAQCTENTIGFSDVGVVSGNPFHAEIVISRSSLSESASSIPETPPVLVARDAQGRIRYERAILEFKRENNAEARLKVEQQWILICDPVAQTTTQIDTMDAFAKIIRPRDSASNLRAIHPRSFCSTQLRSKSTPSALVEHLGTQTVEGVEAHGVRITRKSRLGASSGGDTSDIEGITETWCSDEISAVVLMVSAAPKLEMKTTIVMRNIERTEPDPSLFRIPSGYTVTESVAGPIGHPTSNPQPNAQP